MRMAISIGAWGALSVMACVLAPRAGAEDELTPVHVEKIEVTGTNVKRIDTETGLPVQTITRADIERMGVTTPEQLLQKVSAVGVGGHSLAEGIGDSYRPGLTAVSLRGLGTASTLVLLNGRRLADYGLNSINGGSAVNVNQVPLAAVERVEVLKDGASAIYGSDAIGGVINFILRKDYRGADVSARGSWTQDGGGDSQQYTATAGYGTIAGDRFNVLASLEYQKDKALLGWQRSATSNAARPDLGGTFASVNTWPANFSWNDSPGRVNLTAQAGCDPSVGSIQVTGLGQASSSLAFCRFDTTRYTDIMPGYERLGFYGRAVMEVAPGHRAFAEFSATRTQTDQTFAPLPVGDFTLRHLIYYPAGGPYYPTSVTLPDGTVLNPTGDLQINWRLLGAGPRVESTTTHEGGWAAGLEGSAGGWDYDAVLSGGVSRETDTLVAGFYRESLLGQALQTGLIDVFSGSPLTPQAQALIDAAIFSGKLRDTESRVTSAQAKASREVLSGANGPTTLALGIEFRREELDYRPGEVSSTQDAIGDDPPLQAFHVGRNVASAFAELNIPFIRNLEAQVALRYDHYADAGGAASPKIALRWTPMPSLLFRTSYGTGFRAPSLTDLYLPATQVLNDGVFDPARCALNEDFVPVPIGRFVSSGECAATLAYLVGNPATKPEKSRQWSVGAVYEPLPGNSLGIDFWTIRRKDTVWFPTTDQIFLRSDPATGGGRFVRQPRLPDGTCQGDGSVPTPADVPCAMLYWNWPTENIGKYNVSGIDVSASARAVSQAWGKFTFKIDGTYYTQYRYQLDVDGQYYDDLGVAGYNGAVSRWKHYATVNWTLGPWGATFAQNFVRGWLDSELPGRPSRRVGNCETYDLQGTWDALKELKVVGGINNLFNRDPPASRVGSFQGGYDARYADPFGRTYYLTLKYSFR